MYLYGHGLLRHCIFPYVSTHVLLCTVATIVMSQFIYPPNLLLLQEVAILSSHKAALQVCVNVLIEEGTPTAV